MRDYVLMCQSRRRKNTKDRKQKPEIWFSMCKILHLRKKKGKLLSGKYYRDRCLTSSAFQCLIVKTVKKTCIHLNKSRRQQQKII